MRKIWAVLFVLSIFGVFAQAQVVTLSPEFQLKSDRAYFVIGELEETVQLLRDQDTRQFLEVYDYELNRLNVIDLKLAERNVRVLEAFGYKNYTYVIFSTKARRDVSVHIHKYTGYGELVDSTRTILVQEAFFSPDFKVHQSTRGSKIAISAVEGNKQMLLALFDIESFEGLFYEKLIFENASLNSSTSDLLLAENGVCVLIMEGTSGLFSGNEATVELFKIDPSRGEQLYNSIIIEDMNIRAIDFDLDYAQKSISFYGFGSESRPDRPEFVFSGQLDENLELEYFNQKDFSPQVLRSVYGRQNKVRDHIEGLRLRETLPLSDGGRIIFSEIVKTFTRRPGVAGMQGRASIGGWTDYYYEDILVVRLDKMGKVRWSELLHKRQFSQDDGGIYSSFFLMKNPSSLRVIYNDEIRQDNTVSEYVITPDGYYKRNSLFTTDHTKIQLRFRDAIQLSASSCIVPSERQGRIRLVRLDY